MEAYVPGRSVPRIPTSYQRPEDYEPVERFVERYVCPRGDEFAVVFAVDSVAPELWDCRRHGVVAVRADLSAGVMAVYGTCSGVERAQLGSPSRTHLEYVLERRSPGELQTLLDERLSELVAARERS